MEILYFVVFSEFVVYMILVGIVGCMDFFFQAEDGIRYLVRSRGLGDVYKRQSHCFIDFNVYCFYYCGHFNLCSNFLFNNFILNHFCLLYTSDAADERSSVDLGGRRIIKKKKKYNTLG